MLRRATLTTCLLACIGFVAYLLLRHGAFSAMMFGLAGIWPLLMLPPQAITCRDRLAQIVVLIAAVGYSLWLALVVYGIETETGSTRGLALMFISFSGGPFVFALWLVALAREWYALRRSPRQPLAA